MDPSTKNRISDFICGDNSEKYPLYRTGTNLTRFFNEIGINAVHDGSTRKSWVLSVISDLNGPDLQKVILRLASPKLYGGEREKIALALKSLNEILNVEGLNISIKGTDPLLAKFDPKYDTVAEEISQNDLKPLPPPDFKKLNLENGLDLILEERWKEIQKSFDAEAYLGALILMGSMLEGFFLGLLLKNPKMANTAVSSPRKDGKVKNFPDWTLSEMIDVGHEVGWIQLDVKRFSHALREFRNLIHPYEQFYKKVTPDVDTCTISWYVVQATCNDIANWIDKHGT
ncbi:hypothetical protein [Leptospira wolffii]|uniref:hypothetical protein n=1 Tax=Leptospira wolffii TaxID=409998 RepID=UPI0002DB773B|nr:hypothetical protein [Leptospira wolffii]EPG66448.1 hypothetical protein LEP1GSC061_1032 [Leptospira wolffii serovar Khorat str. Khorat-H2]